LSKPPYLGHSIEQKPYGLNDTQTKNTEIGDGVMTKKIGIGYIPSELVKISG